MKKIICLPYAGGSAHVLRNKLVKDMDSNIEIVPIELPGRGSRFNESLCDNFSDVLKDVFTQVKCEICDGEYSLLGYSFGSRIIYELYYEIIKNNLPGPQAMFFCAAAPPERKYTKALDNESIIKEMRRLGGTDDSIFNNVELLEMILIIMRADIKALQSYEYVEHHEKIHCPIVIQCGNQDSEVVKYVREWEKYTDNMCKCFFYEDGHFFINQYAKEVTDNIVNILKKIDCMQKESMVSK